MYHAVSPSKVDLFWLSCLPRVVLGEMCLIVFVVVVVVGVVVYADLGQSSQLGMSSKIVFWNHINGPLLSEPWTLKLCVFLHEPINNNHIISHLYPHEYPCCYPQATAFYPMSSLTQLSCHSKVTPVAKSWNVAGERPAYGLTCSSHDPGVSLNWVTIFPYFPQ